MKTFARSQKGTIFPFLKLSAALFTCLSLLVVSSCQRDDENSVAGGTVIMKSATVTQGASIYYGHKIFTRGSGKPFEANQVIENPHYDCFSDFVLMIQNGSNKDTRVASAEIWIDGMLVAGPSDFSKKVTLISKPLPGLKQGSVLKVKLNSDPGSFIDLWIEGISHIVTPLFAPVGPLVQDTQVGTLPDISLNGIKGTWYPPTINTASAGYFTYTFTPDDSQCATSATLVIEVTNMGRVTDHQGNKYPTVKIGNQWWMAANLNATVYNNNDPVFTTVPAELNITGETEPKYQWAFGGDEYKASLYGRLYTWYVITDSRGICPDGWHVSTENDWATLIDYLTVNGYGYEGSGTDIAKSMAAPSPLWIPSDIPGTVGNDLTSNNTSGFAALPGGYRIGTGVFNNVGSQSVWWSTGNGTYKALWRTSGEITQASTAKNYGASVRCVKN